jgi:hypothetical protein
LPSFWKPTVGLFSIVSEKLNDHPKNSLEKLSLNPILENAPEKKAWWIPEELIET